MPTTPPSPRSATTTTPSGANREPRPDWLPRDRWPFPLRAIEHRGQSIICSDVGDGPVLLLVHSGFWSFVWRDLMVELRDEFRCIALDAPGTGLNQAVRLPGSGIAPSKRRSTGRSGPVGIDDAAEAVDAVVRQLDLDPLVLVLHDLGGPAGLQAAAAWPDRVRGLVAVNTFGWRPSGAAFRGVLAMMGSTVVRESDAWTGWLPRMSSSRFGIGRQLDRADRRTFRRGTPRPARRAFHHYMGSARRHDFSTVDRAMAQLQQRPALTVFGARNDPLGFQPQWASRFDDITQVEVPGGNHFPMCDAPGLVADSLRRWHSERLS